jgi:two-component system phosphate regulon sensor histidine kinase PhoR
MSNVRLRIFYLLGTISIFALGGLQIYWFKKAFKETEMQFHRNVEIALQSTLQQLAIFNNSESIPQNAIEQAAENYYVVMVNDQINADVLEFLLKKELGNLNVHHAFEYRIYDCQNKELKFGGFVDGRSYIDAQSSTLNPPELKLDNYYFSVYFPNKGAVLLSSMSFWIFSSAVMALIILFFLYSMFVILRQKQLAEMQRNFINTISHEIKTPLAVISASAETLKNADELISSKRLSRYAQIVLEETERLKSKIEKILHSNGSTRTIRLNKKLIPINSFLQKISNHLHPETDKPFTIHTELDKTEGALVNADPEMLESALMNILENACKYSKEGIEITIATQIDKLLCIQIRDKGIGIAPANHHLIFDDFYRVPQPAQDEKNGFGIGLSFAKRLIEMHKGSIRVESQLGQGACFSIYLPYTLNER